MIVAILLNHDDDPSWYNGPPYALAEYSFDEYDMGGCSTEPVEFDATANVRECQDSVVVHVLDGETGKRIFDRLIGARRST